MKEVGGYDRQYSGAITKKKLVFFLFYNLNCFSREDNYFNFFKSSY